MASDADVGNQSSLAKALHLLHLVKRKNQRGARLSDLARLSGHSIPTTRRLLQGLVEGELLTFDPFSKFYYLGIKCVDLGRAASGLEVADTARDRMRELVSRVASRTAENTFFSLRHSDGDAVCVESVVVPDAPDGSTLSAGARRPLGVGSGSAAILASLNPNERERVLQANVKRFRHYNSYGSDDVRRLIDGWTSSRHVFNDGRILPNSCGLALPVFDRSGARVGALSVAGNKARFTNDRKQEILNVMNDAMISLGYVS